ncbi:MAG: hypothetical protein D6719_02125 [Candidatus Dadabacteria bacterium]|nr:MAG: hypothetical protein D6719_02125 [Candidatus Dadabacteria bacterium]
MGKKAEEILFFALALICSLVFACMHIRVSAIYAGALPANLQTGTAHLPYQYRVLIPYLVFVVSKVTPSFLSEATCSAVLISDSELCRVSADLDYSGVFWFFLLDILSIFFSVIVLRAILNRCFPGQRYNSYLPFLLFYVLVFHYIYAPAPRYYYPSDLPALLFFAVGIFLIYRNDLKMFYPVFIIATFNRETSLFLTFIYWFINEHRKDQLRYFVHTVIQLILWAMVKLYLFKIFKTNHGLGIHPNLLQNLELITDWNTWKVLAISFGGLWILLPFIYTRCTNGCIKNTLKVIGPFYGIMLCVGYLPELRIYAELSIPLMLGVAALLYSLLNTDQRHSQSGFQG